MEHMVLARKWRPKKFTDLIGQTNTATILQNILSSGRLHHAYLLTGTRGVGKTTIARIIAKALNCLNPMVNEPCCSCENCLQIDNGRFVDVIEIDAASNTGVDNIREVLENAQYMPSSGKYKIYIIDEVHMLSKSAFNAMLKTLEEPPAHIVFILATTDPQKVPITIISRCLQLKLRHLSSDEITNHLINILKTEQIKYNNHAIEIIANAANGSMRDALSLTDQAIAFSASDISIAAAQQMLGISDDDSILAIIQAIQAGDSEQLVTLAQRLNANGADLEMLLEQINYTLFQISLAQLSPQPKLTAELINLAKLISLQDCQLFFEISNLGLEQIRKASNKYPIFMMSLLRMIAFSLGSYADKKNLINQSNSHANIDLTNNDDHSKKEQDEPLTLPVATAINEDIIITELVLANNTQSIEPTTLLIEEDKVTAELQLNEQTNNKPFSSWLDFVKSLDYNTLDQQLAIILRNSAEDKPALANELFLSINISFQQLISPQNVDKIEEILYQQYQQHFDLNFDFTNLVQTTSLKQQEVLQASAKQQQAEEAIHNDPLIQDLCTTFSAKILPNSIKPI